jgi:hypothetical protein
VVAGEVYRACMASSRDATSGSVGALACAHGPARPRLQRGMRVEAGSSGRRYGEKLRAAMLAPRPEPRPEMPSVEVRAWQGKGGGRHKHSKYLNTSMAYSVAYYFIVQASHGMRRWWRRSSRS